MPLSASDGRSALFKIKAKALSFVRKGLEGVALVRGHVFPVIYKLKDRLEAGDSGGNLRLEDADEVGGVDSGKVDDNWLRGDGRVDRLGDMISELEAGETLFQCALLLVAFGMTNCGTFLTELVLATPLKAFAAFL